MSTRGRPLVDQTIAVTTEKVGLREAMKARRAALTGPCRDAAAKRLAASGLGGIGVSPPAIVSAFRSFGDELDTTALLQRLAADSYRLALPVMRGKAQPLLFRSWAPGDAMRTVQWGIQEPLDSAAIVEPGVVLVPLLAFDRRGHRLGYGGGYYDRTLRDLRLRQTVLAVGLAFDEQEVDAVPHLDYDERLDWILTPSGAIRCQP